MVNGTNSKTSTSAWHQISLPRLRMGLLWALLASAATFMLVTGWTEVESAAATAATDYTAVPLAEKLSQKVPSVDTKGQTGETENEDDVEEDMELAESKLYPVVLPMPIQQQQSAAASTQERIRRLRARRSRLLQRKNMMMMGMRPTTRFRPSQREKWQLPSLNSLPETRRKKRKKNAVGDDMADVPENGRAVSTQEFRTVVNRVMVGDGEEEPREPADRSKSLTISERRDADGTRTVIVETRKKRKRERPLPGLAATLTATGTSQQGRSYDRSPWTPVRRRKRRQRQRDRISVPMFDMPEEKLKVSDPYLTADRAKRNRLRPLKRPRLLVTEEELEQKTRFEANEEDEEDDEEDEYREAKSGRSLRGKRGKRMLAFTQRGRDVSKGKLRVQGRSRDPDDPSLAEIDGGFFDEYIVDFPKEDVQTRYNERPLEAQGVKVVDDDDDDEYSSEYVDEYVDAQDPYQNKDEATTGLRHHNGEVDTAHYDSQDETPVYTGPNQPARRPPYPPSHYGQSFNSPFDTTSPPRFRPGSGHAPAFRSPNPYYNTLPSSEPESEYEIDDDDDVSNGHLDVDDRYKNYNFYDELTQGRDVGEDDGPTSPPSAPRFRGRGQQQQHHQRPRHFGQVHRRRPQQFGVRPGPSYESFRVPPPATVRGQPFRHAVHSPDREAFSQMHNGYFHRGRGQEEQDEEVEDGGEDGGYTDGYVSDGIPEEEDGNDDHLAPNSVYREEVRGTVPRDEDEGEAQGGEQLYRGYGQNKPHYGDYQDTGEDDVMGRGGPEGQPEYPEEQQYRVEEEEEEGRDEEGEGGEGAAGYDRPPRYPQYDNQDDDDRGDREYDDDDGDAGRYGRQEQERYDQRRRPPPSYDSDYFDVLEDDEDADVLASRDDNKWDDYFDGHRKDIDYDIGGLIMSDEEYEPDENSADNSGKQPVEEEQHQRDRGDYDDRNQEEEEEEEEDDDEDARPRSRSNDPPPRRPLRRPPSRDRNEERQDSASLDYDTYMELQRKEREMEREMEADVDSKFADLYRGVPQTTHTGGRQRTRGGRPYSMSFEQVYRPRRYRTRRPSLAPDNSDIPGFDDFFGKIEDAVEEEIGRSPFQEGRGDGGGGESQWRPPTYDSDADDAPADGVADNSGDVRPTVYREDPGRPDSLGFKMPSHAELEENYRTVVTSDSAPRPVVIADFESKRISPRRTRKSN